MGDQTQAYDIFQTPLGSGYPLPLINPRQRWSSTIFSLDLSLLAWRSNIRNVPHRPTSCTSQQYHQYMYLYFQLFTSAPQYVPTVSYVVPLNFSISSPPPFFCVALPSPPSPVNFMWNINPCCFLPDHIIRGFALLTPGFHFLQGGLKKGRGWFF